MHLAERLRKASHMMLHRRKDRFVIITEPPPPTTAAPIFIVGSPRSGTSLMRRIVDSHSRIACPPESHFMAPLLRMLDDEPSMQGFETMGFDRRLVLARLREFSERFFREYAKAQGKPRWADKTPRYVDHLEAIDEMFEGRPQYVMIHRHGIDVAYSMNKAVPGWLAGIPNYSSATTPRDPIRVAAAYWRDAVEKMLAFCTKVPDRTFTLRYEELVREPASTLQHMFTFLGEDFEEAVLRFNDLPHVEGREDQRVPFTRTINGASGGYRAWNQATIEVAVEEAGPAMDALGYRV